MPSCLDNPGLPLSLKGLDLPYRKHSLIFRSSMGPWMGCCFLALVAAVLSNANGCAASEGRNFTIDSDQFLLDGEPFQIISGSMHYFRIHPDHWRDRLERTAAMGLNSVEVYIPWNMHEPYPGDYQWEGFADVERWLDLIHDVGLLVVLRPGPYICAEWDFGGFPWWLASSKVAGGRTMRLRTNDANYLAHVDRWWGTLFSKLNRFLYQNGGPVLMVQVENEYGFCGSDKDYLRHLIQTARTHLGQDVLLFTTDPPGVAEKGSLPGDEVYSVVDFGPGWFDPVNAFAAQRRLNAPGKSPPFCSEFYTGWLSHWGEKMANTSTSVLVDDTRILLEFANSTASMSFYMAHGGTNFGFWAGANVDGSRYMPHITSYDYDAPISEAGDYGQPGIGGESKFHALRDLIANHTGRKLPKVPPRPDIKAYGKVSLKDSLPLFDALPDLYSGDGILADAPDIMEEYGQRWGLILYRTYLAADALDEKAELDLGSPVHDYASVFVDGELLGKLDRDGPTTLSLPARHHKAAGARGDKDELRLDILVEGVGRQNFGCDTGGWDFKGLTSPDVKLNGNALRTWRVFPLQLDSVSGISYPSASHPSTAVEMAAGAGQGLDEEGSVASSRRLLGAAMPTKLRFGGVSAKGRVSDDAKPTFYRGALDVGKGLRGKHGHLPDTYLATHGWGKGIAWVNGFNLGWYWASKGPQMTLYVPGPVLREGENEVVILELEQGSKDKATVRFLNEPDFFGPEGPQPSDYAVAVVPPERRRRVP